MNFNRFNNNDPWINQNQQPNNPNNFYGNNSNNNMIPPLIQYPFHHLNNNFHNQNRKGPGPGPGPGPGSDPNWRYKNFQDFNRNKNRNPYQQKNSRWNNNNNNNNNRGPQKSRSGSRESEDHGKEEHDSFSDGDQMKKSNSRKSSESSPKDFESFKPAEPKSDRFDEPTAGNSKSSEASNSEKQKVNSIDMICAKNAQDVTKKLFNRLKNMDKSNIKDIINNPKLQYETALKVQARQKLRQKMRSELKFLSEGENRDCPDVEADMTVDANKIPMSLIEEIGKTIDLNLLHEELFKENETTETIHQETANDNDERAIEVVTNNLGGGDLLEQAEMLLMDSSSIFDIDDPSEKPEESAEPSTVMISAITDASDVQIMEKMAEDGTLFQNSKEPEVAVFISEDKPWETVQPKVNERSKPEPIRNLIDLTAVEDEKKEQLDSRELTPRKLERGMSRDCESNNGRPLNNSMSPPRRSAEYREPRRDFDARSVSPNDRSRERRREFGKDDYEREKDREWERERQKERIRDRSRPRPRNVPKIWENPPAPVRQEPPFRPNFYQESTSHIRPLLSLNTKPPTPPPEPAKLTDDVISNVYRTKLNNLEPGQETPDLDSILKPRQFQFKGSFKRGAGNKNKELNRSRSRVDQFRNRDRSPRRHSRSPSFGRHNSSSKTSEPDTPKINERDFVVPIEGLKPHMTALKRMTEIDVEITKTLEKMHGIDKVISNLQTERNAAQKSFSRLHLERKQLLESVIKTAQNYVPPVVVTPSFDEEASSSKNNSNDNDSVKSETLNHGKKPVTKNPQMSDGKKRKSEEPLKQVQDEKRRRDNSVEFVKEKLPEHTKDASDKNSKSAKKAKHSETELVSGKKMKRDGKDIAKHRKEGDNDKLKKSKGEMKEYPEKLRKDDGEKSRDVDKIKKENVSPKVLSQSRSEDKSNIPSATSIDSSAHKKKKKPEEADTTDGHSKSHKKIKLNDRSEHKIRKLNEDHLKKALKHAKIQAAKRNQLFDESSFINVPYELKELKIVTKKLATSAKMLDFLPLDTVFLYTDTVEDNKLTDVEARELKNDLIVAEECEIKMEVDPLPEPTTEQFVLVQEQEPAAESDIAISSPKNNDIIVVPSQLSKQDYPEWSGNFDKHTLPVVHIKVIKQEAEEFIVCATEDGKIFKYLISNGDLVDTFTKHTAICNSFIYDEQEFIYSVSSDHYMYKFKLSNFEVVHSEEFHEPLQISDLAWDKLFIGTKVGTVFKFKTKKNVLESAPLCNVEKPILSIKATKEGARKILIISSKTNAIQVRDANDGLLLRQIGVDAISDANVYDMLLHGHIVFCGTSKEEIYSFDFTSGALKETKKCGNGAVCLKACNKFILAACYDGFIYIYDINTMEQINKFQGPGNMLLSMDIQDNKIVASTKDKKLKIINMPV